MRSSIMLWFVLISITTALSWGVAFAAAPTINATNGSQAILLEDIGFHPDINGFSFQNYGNEVHVDDLTPAEMLRMFGDCVVAKINGNNITLTPEAELWMEEANTAMAHGHCEGMAVLSALMYFNKISPTKFGGKAADELALKNGLLQREIAYWWTTQVTHPGGITKINDPDAIVDALAKTFKEGQNGTEWWVMGIYQPNGSDGHSVTPYAVEDMGNGTAKILIYDNNIPKIPRSVEINKTTNTWRYTSSTNPNLPPELYEGNASTKNMEIVSISSRLRQQTCDFCVCRNNSTNVGCNGRALIWILNGCGNMSGNGRYLVTDQYGRRIGYLNNSSKFINEIPNATRVNLTGTGAALLELPACRRSLNNSSLNNSSLDALGLNNSSEIYKIRLDGVLDNVAMLNPGTALKVKLPSCQVIHGTLAVTIGNTLTTTWTGNQPVVITEIVGNQVTNRPSDPNPPHKPRLICTTTKCQNTGETEEVCVPA
jgi:hypothetical protein